MSELKSDIYDAGDAAQVKAKKTKQQLLREREKRDWCEVLETDAGKRLLWRILGECGIFMDPFNTNALVMARATGAQGIGRFIHIEIQEACPEKYLEMQLLAQQEAENG